VVSTRERSRIGAGRFDEDDELLKLVRMTVESTEVPCEHAVAPKLLDISNHSLIFGSAPAGSGRDVVVNVGFGDGDIVWLRPAQTFTELWPHSVLVSAVVLGCPGVNGSGARSRFVGKPW
jgi:hypothetical protein